MASKSPNLGLNLTSSADDAKNVYEWVDELTGETNNSNMVIIDGAFGALFEEITWDEYLPEEVQDGN